MGEVPVAVEDVDLTHRCLGEKVQQVMRRCRRADDGYPLDLQLAGRDRGPGPAGRGVDVAEHRVGVVVDDGLIGARCRGGVHRCDRGAENRHVGGHLVVVVLVLPIGQRGAGQGVLRDQLRGDCVGRLAGQHATQSGAVDVAGRVAVEVDDVGGRLRSDVAAQRQLGHQGAVAGLLRASEIRDVLEQQLATTRTWQPRRPGAAGRQLALVSRADTELGAKLP